MSQCFCLFLNGNQPLAGMVLEKLMMEKEISELALRQSAADCGCAPQDFFREENVVRILNDRPPQARKDLTSKLFFDVVSIGRNSVVCACDALGEEAREFARTFRGKDCFGARALRWIDEKLGRHGLTAGTPTLYFLPSKERKICSSEGVRFCRLEKEELSEYYLPEWRNALCYKRRELDAFAVAAFCGDRLAGLAGASCDCNDMMQIGVDVLPAFRGRGIGSALTARLADEIEAAQKAAFYCCESGNLASIKTALRSGFLPVKTQLSALPRLENDI